VRSYRIPLYQQRGVFCVIPWSPSRIILQGR